MIINRLVIERFVELPELAFTGDGQRQGENQILFKAPASLSEASSGCDLPQSLHEQVALSLLSEAAQELLARQLLAVHCELRQYLVF